MQLENEVKFNIDQYLSGYDMIYLPNLKVQNVPFQKKNIIMGKKELDITLDILKIVDEKIKKIKFD